MRFGGGKIDDLFEDRAFEFPTGIYIRGVNPIVSTTIITNLPSTSKALLGQ